MPDKPGSRTSCFWWELGRFPAYQDVDHEGATERRTSYPLKPEMLGWQSVVKSALVKKLCAIALTFLLATAGRASDLANSFRQAYALADAQRNDRGTQAYLHLDLIPYYKQKYSSVFQSCLKSTENRDTSPFTFVVAIGKDGRVLRLYVDHETNIYACARQTLQQDKFPAPPVSPYYMSITMSFGE